MGYGGENPWSKHRCQSQSDDPTVPNVEAFPSTLRARVSCAGSENLFHLKVHGESVPPILLNNCTGILGGNRRCFSKAQSMFFSSRNSWKPPHRHSFLKPCPLF